jgi:hypothetical protein
MTIRDTDNGMQSLRERLKDLRSGEGWTLEVGVLDADQHVGKDGRDQPVTVADVAAFHEFGLGVPQRSFIGAWFDENEQKLQGLAKRRVTAFLDGSEGKEEILSQVGSFCVGGIQARMAAGIPPELAPATIKAKGSSTPLIDTGQLRTSITFRVK